MANFGVFEKLINKAKELKGKSLVFPEGEDNRVIEAATKLAKEDVCKVFLLGREEVILPKVEGLNITVINPEIETPQSKKFAESLYEIRKNKGLTLTEAESIIKKGIYYACIMLNEGLVDGVVAGALLHSADVMRAAFQIIKGKKETPLVSSCFIMEVPEGKQAILGENGFMIFSDCAVCTHPSAKDLSQIALASKDTAEKICGITPKIAMLSYSTNASKSEDETILKMKEAVSEFKKIDDKTLIEGEIQLDAAIRPDTALIKNPNTKLKGLANVLVFPDINAGNIGYKLVANFAGTRAVGPILQGLNKPVNDLSRGSNAEEIYLTAIITLLQSN